MNTSRPTIHQTLIAVAYEFAKRSTCSRLNVGCVIADERGVILSSGFNGAIAGLPHCDHSQSDDPCRIAMHAEANAILWSARLGTRLEGSRLYVTHEPCYECSKMSAQVGISEVYFSDTYGRNTGRELLREAKVPLYQVRP